MLIAVYGMFAKINWLILFFCYLEGAENIN